MKRTNTYLCALALMMLVMTPAGAQEKGPNDWKYGIAIYLWGTGIEGTSQIGPVSAPVSITFSDTLAFTW